MKEIAQSPRHPIDRRRLRQVRSILEMTQVELARELGISAQLISAWERGDRVPSGSQVEALVAVLARLRPPVPAEAANQVSRGGQGIVNDLAPQDTTRLLTPAQAAELLGISLATVHRRAVLGDLPAIKLWSGRRAPIRFRRDDLERWLEARRVKAPRK